MAEAEINVITHLLDVEQEASALIKDAQEEANKRIAAARVQADADYKNQYDQLIKKLDADYQNRIKEISEKYNKAAVEYRSSVEKTEQDKKALNAFLDKFLVEN